jgi:RluA family pseudouridine synthase
MSSLILFEDDQLLAANKPAGLPSHATHDPLRPHFQGAVEQAAGRPLVLFHRLDLDTTGIVLFGKDPAVNRVMTEMFRDRKIHKTYWAVVGGRWPESWKEVRTFIKKTGGGRWANVPKGKGGDSAETRFRALASSGERTLVEASPVTGRTHQIRLHCLERGHPILGDRQYGRPHPQGVPMALHARALTFLHPTTGREVRVEAPLPDYWQEHWLRGLAAPL